MDQQTYLKKFSHFVRWRLPKPEADEVLADYEALFSERLPGNDDAWIQDLGEPLEAARLLTERMEHRNDTYPGNKVRGCPDGEKQG